jgi:hypothetical protein
MGYYGASRCHTNPLLELTHGPIIQNNSVTLAAKYATAYPKPVATKGNEKRQHHDMKGHYSTKTDFMSASPACSSLVN